MAKQTQNSSHFFRVILPRILETGSVELPTKFVKEHGKHLSKYAQLKVPTGAKWKIKLKMQKNRAWLQQGWPDFVKKYSIKCGHFLVFKYKGRSRFTVRIFDLSTSEIEYARFSHENAEKAKPIQIKEEDDSLDECLQNRKTLENANKSRVDVTRAKERAKAFKSSNLHFIVIMRPTYYRSLYIPSGTVSEYLRKRENKSISIEGEDGRIWPIKYNIGPLPRLRMRLCSGWIKFVQEYHLQEGDECTFELVSSKSITFKIHIKRVSDEQVSKKGALVVLPDIASSSAMKTKKSFEIRMTSFYVSCKGTPHIPFAHAERYLKEARDGKAYEVIIHGSSGKTWVVHCCHSSVKNSIFKNVRFVKGWKDFVSDNRIRVGNICKFEKIHGKAKAYKVTISRCVAAHE